MRLPPATNPVTGPSVDQSFIAAPAPRIVHGSHAIEGLCNVAYELDAKRVLLITDRDVFDIGHATTALHSLKDVGCVVTVCDEICDQLSEDDIDCAVEFARDSRPQLIVALGGNSVLAAAKVANIIYSNGGRTEDYVGQDLKGKHSLPLVCIPTAAGSGSELHNWAVVGKRGTMAALVVDGPPLQPHTTILDPLLVPGEQPLPALRCGILALGLAVECSVSSQRTPISLAYSREAFRLLYRTLSRLLIDAQPPERISLADCAELQVGAAMSGLAALTAMPGAAYAAAIPLNLRGNLPLAEAVTAMLPAVIRMHVRREPIAQAEYAILLQLGGIPAGTQRLLADVVEELRDRAGISTDATRKLLAQGRHVEEYAAEAAALPFAQANPYPITAHELRGIYRSI